jgi:hypothetical protein
MKLIDENDKKASLPNLAIILGIVGGLLLMFGGLIKDVPEVYIPASAVACAALGGAGVKAHRKTS